LHCKSCDQDKPESEFPIRKDRSNRLRPYCKDCATNIAKARYHSYKKNSPFKNKCSRVKARSIQINVPFDLSPEYLEEIWTGYCPVLNIPIELDVGVNKEYSAELDRFIPSLGYIKGNVAFLSRRINRIKDNATIEELEKLVKWMSR
jgi:hypothetical protein